MKSNSNTTRKSSEWFSELMGFSESKWDFKTDSIPSRVQSMMGNFNTVSVGKLITKAKKKSKDKSQSNILIVTIRESMNMEHLFDTSSLQVSGPKGAMYQVASNFNCIEVGSEMTNPFSGKFLTNLMSDKTQGPSAAAGAAAGAILRLAKHRKTPISLLKNVEGINDRNGKVYHDDIDIDIDIDFTKILIGLHTDVHATYDRRRNHFRYYHSGPVIDQVFTSTCICNKELSSEVQEAFLDAAYQGTYAAAIVRNSCKLVLTAIGGGCFRNNQEQIAQAICKAHKRFSPFLNPKCEVHFPIYIDGKDMVKYLSNNMTIKLNKI